MYSLKAVSKAFPKYVVKFEKTKYDGLRIYLLSKVPVGVYSFIIAVVK